MTLLATYEPVPVDESHRPLRARECQVDCKSGSLLPLLDRKRSGLRHIAVPCMGQNGGYISPQVTACGLRGACREPWFRRRALGHGTEGAL